MLTEWEYSSVETVATLGSKSTVGASEEIKKGAQVMWPLVLA